MEWFRNREEARILIEMYRQQYNRKRVHSSLGYRTPAEVASEPLPRFRSAQRRNETDAESRKPNFISGPINWGLDRVLSILFRDFTDRILVVIQEIV